MVKEVDELEVLLNDSLADSFLLVDLFSLEPVVFAVDVEYPVDEELFVPPDFDEDELEEEPFDDLEVPSV
jgi:hypothetical protein